jgi:ribosome-binding protein aMBF1 (putative translation factor)
VPRATRTAGDAYTGQYYNKRTRWTSPPPPPRAFTVVIPPENDRRVAALRAALYLSQAQLAEKIGAAGKAVVYQWESRKRVPSRLFWSQVVAPKKVQE